MAERKPYFEDFERGEWVVRLDNKYRRAKLCDDTLESRQDCEDLIALLERVRERLPP